MNADPRFPVGPPPEANQSTPAERRRFIDEIAACPAAMRRAVAGLDDRQLDTPYREGGWTVRQVVHHVPDSHLNAYTRHKLAKTEHNPTIRPYDQEAWAILPDGSTGDIDCSLRLLEAVHERWVRFLRALEPADFARTFYHPESKRSFTLDGSVAHYAWHCRHHVGHIQALRHLKKW